MYNDTNPEICVVCKQPKTKMVKATSEEQIKNDFYICTNPNCFLKADITKIKGWKPYGQIPREESKTLRR